MREMRACIYVKFFDYFLWCFEEKYDRNIGKKVIVLISQFFFYMMKMRILSLERLNDLILVVQF